MYGSAVLSPEEFAKQAAIQAAGGMVYGEAVTGVNTAAVVAAAVAAVTAEVPGQRTLKQIEQVLTENPGAFAEVLAAEVARIEGPRKGAVALLRGAAEIEGSGATSAQVAALDTLLA